MAFAVWPSRTTIGTTAIPDIATVTKKADVLSLPWWYSQEVLVRAYAAYGALNDKAVTVAAKRLRIIKG
jgi:hypothetical protein